MTAIILGPELDLMLKGIGEDLKGKTQLEEPYVDKKTILRAVREQNKVIITLQERILKMEEVEEGILRTLDQLQERVDYFEKYTKKVDDIEDVLAEKIPLVDKLNQISQEHDAKISTLSSDMKDHVKTFTSFKTDTRQNMAVMNDDIENLQKTVSQLPNTIMISSNQVKHIIKDETSNNDDGDDENQQHELLSDVIAHNEQRSFVHDEKLNNLTEKVDENENTQSKKNTEIDNDIEVLMKWKDEQSSVDLVTIRDTQSNMKTMLDDHESTLKTKMSIQDAERKLKAQFNEIVDHLQMALATVETDEADFKSVTDSLSKMCESLREKKADKADLASLRKQFIDHQVDNQGEGSLGVRLGSSTIDNDTIRQILNNYPTKDYVERMLNRKVDKEAATMQFDRLESSLQNIQTSINELKSHAADEAFAIDEKLLKARTEATMNLLYANHRSKEFESSLTNTVSHHEEKYSNHHHDNSNRHNTKETDDIFQVEGVKISPTEEDHHRSTVITSNKRKLPQTENEFEQQNKFPSSSVTRGPLSDVVIDDSTISIAQLKTLDESWVPKSDNILEKNSEGNTTTATKNNDSRLKSAPNMGGIESEINQDSNNISSLFPSILTTTKKEVRPRSREVQSPNVYKGSYQIIPQQQQHGLGETTATTSLLPILDERLTLPKVVTKVKHMNSILNHHTKNHNHSSGHYMSNNNKYTGNNHKSSNRKHSEKAIEPKTFIIRTSIG